jgi:hypothetical protein
MSSVTKISIDNTGTQASVTITETTFIFNANINELYAKLESQYPRAEFMIRTNEVFNVEATDPFGVLGDYYGEAMSPLNSL